MFITAITEYKLLSVHVSPTKNYQALLATREGSFFFYLRREIEC